MNRHMKNVSATILTVLLCVSLVCGCTAPPTPHEEYISDAITNAIKSAYSVAHPSITIKEASIKFENHGNTVIAFYELSLYNGQKQMVECDQASSQRLNEFVNDIEHNLGCIITVPQCPQLRLGDDGILHLNSPKLTDQKTSADLLSQVESGNLKEISGPDEASVLFMLYSQFEDLHLNKAYINEERSELWLDTSAGIYHFHLINCMKWEEHFYAIRIAPDGYSIISTID